MSEQRYLGQAQSSEHPDAIADPGVADDVCLYSQDEDRPECRSDPRDAPQDEPAEQREVPRDPEQRPDQARLGTDLGVVRLAGLDRRPRARGGLARVAEPVSLRMVNDGAHALAQADPVTVQRRFVDAAGV